MGRQAGTFGIAVAAFLVVAGTVLASAQAPRPPVPTAPEKLRDRALTPDESVRLYDQLGKPTGVRLYEGLCARAREFVAKKGAVDDPLLSQFNTVIGSQVVNALLNYCATGRFVLNFSDSDGKCTRRAPLTPAHVQLITRLPFVRASDVEIIALGCVAATQNVVLLNARAHSVLITDSEVGGVNITGGSLTSSVLIQDTTVNGLTTIEGMTVGSSLEILRSTLDPYGGNPAPSAVDERRSALLIFASSVGSLRIQDSQIKGDVYINDNLVKGATRFGPFTAPKDGKHSVMVDGTVTMTRNDIKGDLRIIAADVRNNLDLRNNFVERGFYVGGGSEIMGWLELFGSRALTMELFGLTVHGLVGAVAVRVTETIYIGESSSGTEKVDFKSGASLRNVKADRLRLSSATIGGQLTLTALTANDVGIYGTKIEKRIHSGDARVRAMSIRDSTMPEFDCTDCEISQYLLLAGKFSGEVNLRGAQIRASLIFRDGEGERNGSAWAPGSHLDLRSIQVETIEADLCDLRIKSDGGDACTGPIVPTLITGAKFQNIVSGRYPTVKGMTSGLLDQNIDTIVAWIRASRGDERFHPQPYDLVASALERVGRHQAAVGVRIAKLDDDYAYGNHSFLMKGVAAVARVLIGYGYQNERSVVAFALLVATGMGVFLFGRNISPIHIRELKLKGTMNVLWYAFWFSIDRAVPPLHIDETMKQYSVLKPLARAYFYFHRGFGMIILSFFVAGIAGLFKS